MGAAFILTALAVLGGDSLADFALALLIGLAVGTYSFSGPSAPNERQRSASRRVSRTLRPKLSTRTNEERSPTGSSATTSSTHATVSPAC